MQCLQLYLKDSARAWLRGLPKGSIKSWDDLVDAFVANFQATYKRPVGIEELRHCQQKQKESMRAYIGRFTKLLNAAEDVSVDRAFDAFSDGIRRETYIEELGRKKPKTITKLMEIANSWADGEDNFPLDIPIDKTIGMTTDEMIGRMAVGGKTPGRAMDAEQPAGHWPARGKGRLSAAGDPWPLVRKPAGSRS
ncbi:hypothetical protein QYE76_035290 [Lolium multiflorum]|uniref:Retrotransposon gag domain-containing protein n=1 Tax=Lolium multiflorum TaxID=4521 RepID=A0AAD8QZR0_LOLMU|nr:hypothetical protein QYE76_035290 [Lolium multiflorum]